jgi:hypothetical protein
MLKRPRLFWIVGMISAWLADFLFWKNQPGITVVVWVVFTIIAGIVIIRKEGVKPAFVNIALMVLAISMGCILALRQEPFTRFVASCLMLLALMLFTFSYQKGYWIFYRVRDHIMAFFLLIIGFLGRGATLKKNQETARTITEEKATKTKSQKPLPPALPEASLPSRAPRKIWAVLRGLLIALPIIAILAALLASADLAFNNQLTSFLELLRIEKLPEYLFRLIYILVFGYLLTGVLLHAGFPKKPEIIPDGSTDHVKPFLGWIESVIILGSIEALFAFFIVFQIRYLFGAQVNISAAGFTYADYARRGFFELVTVAVLSLLIYVILSAITKREQPTQRKTFSILVIILMVLVLAILGSSFQRLALYESAYGFAYLRTYTHFFIPWMAVLLAMVVLWELLRKQRFFMLSVIVCIFGFGITLAAVNVDGFMAEKNIQRALQGEKLDALFLSQLSYDAVPVLIREFTLTSQKTDVKDALGANLSCRLAEIKAAGKTSWKSFHLGAWMAAKSLVNLAKDLKHYPTNESDSRGWTVKVNGVDQDCWSYLYWD